MVALTMPSPAFPEKSFWFSRPLGVVCACMKTSLFLLAALLLSPLATFAAEEKPAAPAAPYPLKICVVSDEELGSMGKPIEFIYKQEGKPDRKVLLCCKMCVGSFKKKPAEFLAKIDEAVAAQAKAAGGAAPEKAPAK